jgi:hypothetical protein
MHCERPKRLKCSVNIATSFSRISASIICQSGVCMQPCTQWILVKYAPIFIPMISCVAWLSRILYWCMKIQHLPDILCVFQCPHVIGTLTCRLPPWERSIERHLFRRTAPWRGWSLDPPSGCPWPSGDDAEALCGGAGRWPMESGMRQVVWLWPSLIGLNLGPLGLISVGGNRACPMLRVL